MIKQIDSIPDTDEVNSDTHELLRVVNERLHDIDVNFQSITSGGDKVSTRTFDAAGSRPVSPYSYVNPYIDVYEFLDPLYARLRNAQLKLNQSGLMANSIGQDQLQVDSILARHIVANTITADKMDVDELSAIVANLGTITAGNMTLDSSGFIRGGGTSYMTGTGFWMGYTGGAYKLHIGNPLGNFLAWNGTSLTIVGSITASSGTIGGWTIGATTITGGSVTLDSTGNIRAGQTAYNTGTGFWLGVDSGTPKFSIGDGTTNALLWSGTALSILASGALTTTGNIINTRNTSFLTWQGPSSVLNGLFMQSDSGGATSINMLSSGFANSIVASISGGSFSAKTDTPANSILFTLSGTAYGSSAFSTQNVMRMGITGSYTGSGTERPYWYVSNSTSPSEYLVWNYDNKLYFCSGLGPNTFYAAPYVDQPLANLYRSASSVLKTDASFIVNRSFQAVGLAQFGTTAGVSGASVTAVNNILGNSYEFGHNNTAGYRGVLGNEASSGKGFLAFHAEAGTNINTYKTRGVLGSVLRSNAAGGFDFCQIPVASADNQTATVLAQLTTTGFNAAPIGQTTAAAGSFTTLNASSTTKVDAFNYQDAEVHGASGGGASDDTTAISNAITAAGSGGLVVLRAGRNYQMRSQITITSPVTIIGYGATISSDTDAHFQKFKISSTNNCRIIGITFNCAYSSTAKGISAGVIEINNSNDCIVRDCTFNDVAKNGVYVVGTSARNQILHNTFYRNYCAVFSDDDGTNQPTYLSIIGNCFNTGLGATTDALSGAIKISGHGTANSHVGHVITANFITNYGEMGIELQEHVNDCTISSNTIIGTKYGMSLSGIERACVSGNTLKQITDYGIEVAASAIAVACENNVIVGRNTSGTLTTFIGYSIVASTYTTVTGGTISGCSYGFYIQPSGGTVKKVGIFGLSMDDNDQQIYIKTTTNVTISGCQFDMSASTNCISLDTTSGACKYVLISNNVFNGTPTNSIFQFYVPGTNVIDYVTICNNDTSDAGAGAAGSFNEPVAGSITYITHVRCFGNTGVLSADNFSTVVSSPVWTITSNQSLPYRYYALENGIINANATGGNIALQVIDPTNMGTWSVTVVKTDASGNTVTISCPAGGTFDGAATIVLAAQWKRVTIKSNGGANYSIVQSN
jgi:parallel beta-helix repeat protein